MLYHKLYATLVGTLLTVAALAQPVTPASSNVYVKVYGAYGFLVPGSTKGATLLSSEPVRFKVSKKAMGGGVRAGLGFGVILNEFINLGVDGEFLKGDKVVDKQNITAEESRSTGGSGYSFEAERSVSHEVVSIIPNIVFKAISTPGYYIYTRLGVVVGVPIKVSEKYYQHYNYHNDQAGNYTIEDRDIIVNYNGEHKLKVAVGYQFSIGVQAAISEKLRGFLEISAYNISYNRIRYEDNERLAITNEKNKLEAPQPTVYDHSKVVYHYTSNGATGSIIRGVHLNYTAVNTYAQQPIIMNAITIGAGIAYRF